MNEYSLKPCPFCGSDKVQFMHSLDLVEVTGIYCYNCKAFTKWNISMGKKETCGSNMEKWAEKWNRRE